jgi:hypothetical protein
MRGAYDMLTWSHVHVHVPAVTRRQPKCHTKAADKHHTGPFISTSSETSTIDSIPPVSLSLTSHRVVSPPLAGQLNDWIENPATLASCSMAYIISSLEDLSCSSAAVGGEPELFDVLLREVDRRLGRLLTPTTMSSAGAAILRLLHAMATRYASIPSSQPHSYSSQTLELLGQCLIPTIASLRPRQLRNLLRNLSTLDWYPSDHMLQEELLRVCCAYYRALHPNNVAFLSSLITAPNQRPPPTALMPGTQRLGFLLPAIHWAVPKSSMADLARFARALQYTQGIWKNPSPEGKLLLPQVTLILEEIAVRAARCVDGANPEDVSHVISALHRLELQPNKHLLTVVEVWADRRLSALTPHALTLALASFARMGTRSPRLLSTAASCVEGCLTRRDAHPMKADELAKIVWAFARLDFYPGNVVLSHAMRVLEQQAHTLPDIAASNLLWAVTRFLRDGDNGGGPNQITFDANAVATTLLPVARLYSGQSAALVLWSLATLTSTHKSSNVVTINRKIESKVVTSFLNAVVNDMDSVDAHSISLATWAIGTLRFGEHSAFVEAVSLAVVQDHPELSTYDPHHLSNLVWGVAKSGIYFDKTTLRVLSDACTPRVEEFAASELFPLCWGFATMGYSHPSFIYGSVNQFKARKDEFGGLELTGMLWSLAKLLDTRKVWEAKQEVVHSCLQIAATQLAGKSHVLQPSQVGMVVWAVGKLLSNYSSALVGDKIIEVVSMTTCSLVLDHLPRLDPVSVSSVAHGIRLIDQRTFTANPAFKEIKHKVYHALRSKVISPTFLEVLNPWEFGSLAMHLAAYLDPAESSSTMDLGVKELLTYARAEALATKAAPGSAIQLLIAMTKCKCYPPGAYAAIFKRLESLSPSYNLGCANLRLLYDAIERLKEQNMPVPLLSKVWVRRMRDLQGL